MRKLLKERLRLDESSSIFINTGSTEDLLSNKDYIVTQQMVR